MDNVFDKTSPAGHPFLAAWTQDGTDELAAFGVVADVVAVFEFVVAGTLPAKFGISLA